MKNNRLRVALLAMLLNVGVCTASAAPSVQVGFSPEGSAQQLVMQTLDDARQSVRLMGYSFTSLGERSGIARCTWGQFGYRELLYGKPVF